MARVLVTGMSGAGKSTLLGELAVRGYVAVDTDEPGWHVGETAWWDEERMSSLLASHATVAVCGTAENQGRFGDRFEHVVYLLAPLEVLLERVAGRWTNPYGRRAEERADIARYVETVEPRIRATATCVLDARLPLVELADRVAELLGPPPVGIVLERLPR